MNSDLARPQPQARESQPAYSARRRIWAAANFNRIAVGARSEERLLNCPTFDAAARL
jgi:hypothetical protein